MIISDDMVVSTEQRVTTVCVRACIQRQDVIKFKFRTSATIDGDSRPQISMVYIWKICR